MKPKSINYRVMENVYCLLNHDKSHFEVLAEDLIAHRLLYNYCSTVVITPLQGCFHR